MGISCFRPGLPLRNSNCQLPATAPKPNLRALASVRACPGGTTTDSYQLQEPITKLQFIIFDLRHGLVPAGSTKYPSTK